MGKKWRKKNAAILTTDDNIVSSREVWERQHVDQLAFELMEYGFFCQKLKAICKEWKEKKLAEWEEHWNESEAKTILLSDLEAGDLPVSVEEMSAKDAWNDLYVFRSEFFGMTLRFFIGKLAELRKEHKRKEAIDWEPSAARSIIISGLGRDVLKADVSAKEAWDLVYGQMPEFQFEEKLNDNRKQIGESHKELADEEALMLQDLKLLPMKMRNSRGEQQPQPCF